MALSGRPNFSPALLTMLRSRLDIVIPVYRDAVRATAVLEALLGCDQPEGVTVRIRVVDDGSGDETPDLLALRFGHRIDLIRLPANLGRSGARNAAARDSTADLILFLDADCIPLTTDFLVRHVTAMADADVSIGSVIGKDDGFWHHYQAVAVRRRKRLVRLAPSAAFTTQNVMIAASRFAAVGGFDEGYVGYGFEDRDLALRLAQEGARFTVTTAAAVRHNDDLSIAGVCRKMREAGERTSTRFAAHHPAEYISLGYAAIDARRHPWRGRFGAVARWIATPLTAAEAWLQWSWLPRPLRVAAVRGLIALHYLDGTRHAAADVQRSR